MWRKKVLGSTLAFQLLPKVTKAVWNTLILSLPRQRAGDSVLYNATLQYSGHIELYARGEGGTRSIKWVEHHPRPWLQSLAYLNKTSLVLLQSLGFSRTFLSIYQAGKSPCHGAGTTSVVQTTDS